MAIATIKATAGEKGITEFEGKAIGIAVHAQHTTSRVEGSASSAMLKSP